MIANEMAIPSSCPDRSSATYSRDRLRVKSGRRRFRKVNMMVLLEPDSEPIDKLKTALIARMILDATIARKIKSARYSPSTLNVLKSDALGDLSVLEDGLNPAFVRTLIDQYEIKASMNVVLRLAKIDFAE